ARRPICPGRQECLLTRHSAPVAAERCGEATRRAAGGLGVSPRRAGPRALVPARGGGVGAAAVVPGRSCRPPPLAGRGGTVPISAGACDAAPGAVGGSSPGRVRVTEAYSPRLAWLPLLLWKTPPGLELILGQDGVAFEMVRDAHPLSFRRG